MWDVRGTELCINDTHLPNLASGKSDSSPFVRLRKASVTPLAPQTRGGFSRTLISSTCFRLVGPERTSHSHTNGLTDIHVATPALGAVVQPSHQRKKRARHHQPPARLPHQRLSRKQASLPPALLQSFRPYRTRHHWLRAWALKTRAACHQTTSLLLIICRGPTPSGSTPRTPNTLSRATS